MKNIQFTLATLLISFICHGQSNDLPNREAYVLKLAVDDTNFYQTDVKSTPYVLPDNTIQLYPGEKINLEIELEKREIKSMKVVKENFNPEKTITISFTQNTEGKLHKGMMLRIENPFDKELKYEAMIFLMKYNKWVSTSVLPIKPKLGSFEMWPDVIVTVALSGWKFK